MCSLANGLRLLPKPLENEHAGSLGLTVRSTIDGLFKDRAI